MSLQLLVVDGPDRGRTFTLSAGPDLMLGRSAQAQYQLTDPTVSRNHCQVTLKGETAFVACNNGSGGTLVNGQKVTRQALKVGDVIQIGNTKLRFQVGDHPVDADTPPAPKKAAVAGAGSELNELSSLVGTTLAHYDISMAIGTGRSCVVFHATDTKDNKPVALKVLQPGFSADDGEMQRFIRAIKTMLPLRHPNLVGLYGAGKTGAYCWIAMEYVAGENLQQVIDRIGAASMLDWGHAFRVAVDVGRALEYAAQHNIIHRNVTPTNILRDAMSKVCKLGDLMLAKALEGVMNKPITRPGEIIGDIAYMSPERTRGTEGIDARSDLYGLGATLYALLTGRPPCTGATLVEKITRIRQHQPEKPTKFQMSISGSFEGVVLRLLAKRPEERYQSATELLRELTRIGKFSGISV